MTDQALYELRFPIGEFYIPKEITTSIYQEWLEDIEMLPAKLRTTVEELNAEQINTVYRPGGWTVKQLVHHLVDSHLNSYTRFKLALTEDKPTIRPYFEDRWAELPDSVATPVDVSLNLLDYLHQRWMFVLKALTESDLQRTFIHPESLREFTLLETVATYAWHSNHHLAHIQRLIARNNW